jgi:uncharacterized protein YndB with AHSA1/START domain
MTNLGLIDDNHILSFTCILPASVERTWFYLTQPEGLRVWLADGSLESRLRGNVKLRFQSGEALVRSNSGTLIRGAIVRHEPYRTLAYSWIDASHEMDVSKDIHGHSSGSTICFELAGHGQNTWMSLTHSGLPTHVLAKVGSGWHTHLNILITAMRDEIAVSVPAPFAALSPRYDRHAAILHMDSRA